MGRPRGRRGDYDQARWEEASTSIAADPQEYRLLHIGDTVARTLVDTLPAIVEYRDGGVLGVSNEPYPRVLEGTVEGLRRR